MFPITNHSAVDVLVHIFTGCGEVKRPYLQYDFFHFERSYLRMDLKSDWTRPQDHQH